MLLGRDVPEPKGDMRAVKLVTAFPWRRGHVKNGLDIEARSEAGIGSLDKPGLVWCSWLLHCRRVLACVVAPPFLDVMTGTRSDQTGWDSWR